MASWLKVDRKYNWKKNSTRNDQRRDLRQLQKYRLLRTFVHPITFKFYPSLILHFKLSSESVSWIYRGNEEWMSPNHNCNEGKSSIIVEEEWTMFFLCPDKPLHGIRSWIRLDRHQRVAGCVGWLFGFVGFFMVCGVVGMERTFFVVC